MKKTLYQKLYEIEKKANKSLNRDNNLLACGSVLVYLTLTIIQDNPIVPLIPLLPLMILFFKWIVKSINEDRKFAKRKSSEEQPK